MAGPLRRSSDRAGGAGRQSWARGRILIFRKIIYYVFSAKSTHEKTPTLYLPYTYPRGGRERGKLEARGWELETSKAEKKAKGKKKIKRNEKLEKKRKGMKSWKRAKRRNAYPRAGRAQPKARPSPLEPGRSSPLRRPLPAGESETLGKSRRRTAYPQQIVTTRLLYCLQDRFAQLSRLQRI